MTWLGDIAEGESFLLGSVPAAPTITVADGMSGPASGEVAGYSTAFGSHTLTATAYDVAGNMTVETRSYSVTAEQPTINYALTPPVADGLDGWYTSSVSLAWTVADPSSTGTLVPTGCVDQDITADQVATTYSCSVTTIGGTTGPVDVSIKRDATPPTMTWLGGIADGRRSSLASYPPLRPSPSRMSRLAQLPATLPAIAPRSGSTP